MSEELSIIAGGKLLGRVIKAGNRLSFRYEASWQKAPASFPLSVSMPLAVAEHLHRPVEAFLRGLLPDNDQVLEQWGKRFQVSPRNPFRLLQHVGEDCPGAVQFVDPGREHEFLATDPEEHITWLGDDELAERIQQLLKNPGATRISTDTGQFSLAGAQPKIALYRDHDTDRWGVPEGQTPTTHILKPAAGHFAGYAENEHFCLRLADDIGLRAASSSIIHPGGQPVIVVKRYDRLLRDGRHVRVHQEDVCQALALAPALKYQNEGGPSVRDVAELLWDVSSDGPGDVLRFADALIFNWMILGTDAHAKNYSLLIAAGGQVRLAPLYDLASALPYPKDISPHKARMSMRIGSKYPMKQIRKRHWEACAKELRIPASVLLERINDLAEQMPAATKATAAKIREEGLEHSIVGELAKVISERSQSCLAALSGDD